MLAKYMGIDPNNLLSQQVQRRTFPQVPPQMPPLRMPPMAQMQQSAGRQLTAAPSRMERLSAFLAQPGLSQALMATGSAMLAQSDQPGTLGGALGRALPYGMQAFQQAKEQREIETLIEQAPPEMRSFLRAGPQGLAMLQMLQKQRGEGYTLGPNEVRYDDQNRPVAMGAEPDSDEPLPALLRGILYGMGVHDPDQATPEQMAEAGRLFMEIEKRPLATATATAGGTPQETEVQRAFGKEYVDVQGAANQAQTALSTLEQMAEWLDNPSVYQGMGGDAVVKVKALGAALGMDVEGLDVAQAAQSLSDQMALQFRTDPTGGMPGQMAYQELLFLRNLPPHLRRTREGNKLVIEVRRRALRRQVEVADAWREYKKRNGGYDEGVYDFLNEKFKDRYMFKGLVPELDKQIADNPYMAP